MIKVKDGYAKLINTSYTGDISLVLLSNGGTIGYDVSTNTILATIGSNVASADKLKNEVKLWGLYFDGTRDVRGSIHLGEGADYEIGTGYSSRNPMRYNKIVFGCSTTGIEYHGGNWTGGSAIAHTFIVGSPATKAMIINNSGNITIGSSDLAETNYKLYVDGNIRTTGIATANKFVSGDGINDFSAGTVKLDVLNIPTSSGGTTFGPGSNGQVLKSNGTTVYWASDNNSNSWRAIQVNGTQIAGTGTDTYALNFISGTGITVAGTSGSSSAANSITITNAGVRSVTIGTDNNANKVAVNTNGTTAYLTIPYATESNSTRYLQCPDTRSTNIVPSSYSAGLSADFKSKSITGLTAAFSGVITFRPYSSNSDWTGGPIHNLAFDANGIHHRTASSDTWGSWKTLAYISDIPTVTNYYWANVAVSSTSSTTTSPTFANVFADAARLDNYLFMNPSGEGIYLNNLGLHWHNKCTYTKSILLFTKDGLVGIGGTPSYKLDVSGTFNSSNYQVGGALELKTDDTTCQTTIFGSNSSGYRMRIVRQSTATNLNTLYSPTLVVSSLDTHAYIAWSYSSDSVWVGGGSGNRWAWRSKLVTSANYGSYLGYIGTTAVLKSSAAQALTGITNATLSGKLTFTTAAATASISFLNGELIDGYGNVLLGTNSASWKVFNSSRSSLITVLKSGNVGIGTTSPSHKLHVNGSVYGDHYYGNAITLYTRGSGTYNRAWISAKDDAGDFIVEAPLTTDSVSGTRAPITLTWRRGYSAMGGLKITGHSEAVLGGNKIWHAGNDGSGSGLDADMLDGKHLSSFITYELTTDYVGASFNSEYLSKKAASTYIEYWDGAGGWFNSRWGLVLAISGFHRVGSSDSYVLLGGGGHKAVSDFAEASALDNYLPLSGGTLTSSSVPLYINRTDSNSYALIGYRIASKDFGYLGFSNNGDLVVSPNRQNGNTNYYAVWHSGNDGSGSGLDADLLDGLQPSNLYVAGISEVYKENIDFEKGHQKLQIISATSENALDKGFPTRHVSGLSVISDYVGWQMVTYGGARTNNPYFRKLNDNNVWSAWKQLAFTDSNITGNAATADKLKNKVKIWGLNFDGSSDVNGNLTPHANNSFTLGTSSERWSNVYSYLGNFAGNVNVGGHLILKGSTTENMTYSGNVHPAICFENSDSSQNVRLIFTDYDSYRSPAGLKLVGNQGGEWLEVAGITYGPGFYHTSYGSSSYLLRSDGGAAAFNWSGQSGQPTWLWGGNSQHTYYVYNPSNFNVNSAAKLRVVSCYNGTTNNDLWSTIKSSNSSYLGTSTMYEVYNDGGPTTYGHVLDTVTVHSNHWQSQLWMASGKGGRLYYRNKDYNNDTWGDWRTVAWTSDIPSVGNGTVTIKQAGTTKGSFTMNQSGNTTIELTDNNTNTHWTTRIYAGASSTAANAAATNPYLKVTDDNTYRNLVRFVGGGATSVSSDANGNITISSTNTTYSFAAKGSATQGIYLSSTNTFSAMTYSLGATVNAGTASKLAYYSGANAISAYTSTCGDYYKPIYLSGGVPIECYSKYWGAVSWGTNCSGTIYVYLYGPIVILLGYIYKLLLSNTSSTNYVFKLPSGAKSPTDKCGFCLVQNDGYQKDRNTVIILSGLYGYCDANYNDFDPGTISYYFTACYV